MSQKLSRYAEFTLEELEELERGLGMSSTESCEINTQLNEKLSKELNTLIEESRGHNS